VNVCELCEEPLDDGRAIQLSIDGSGVHDECVDTMDDPEEEDE
jgi:hypothetical protein